MFRFFIDHSQTVLELLFRFFIEQTLIADLALFDPILIYRLVDAEPQPVKVPDRGQSSDTWRLLDLICGLTHRCCRP